MSGPGGTRGPGASGAAPLLERPVEPDRDGARIDVVLAEWLAEPRARVQTRLADGQVLIDGVVAAKSRRLRDGEIVTVLEAPAPEAPPAPGPVPLRYEDEHLAVVAKPAGMVVHPGAGTGTGREAGPTLVAALEHMGVALAAAGDRPGIVHRLDRGTSGLLVVAKTPEALEALQDMFRRHEAERTYWALVDGVPDQPHATIDAPLSRHPVKRTRFTIHPQGRRAVSHYDTTEAFGRAAVISVRLETGRTHQVRVHLSSIGHPVTGDRTYGASQGLAAELGLERPALHAQRLAFVHPVTSAPVEVSEPLPDDLRHALARLRGQ